MKAQPVVGQWPIEIGSSFHGARIVGSDCEYETVTLDWRQSNKINLVDICDGCPVPQEAGEWQARAQRAEAEVGKLTMDMQELLAENTDQKAMLADAGIRNGVLAKRLDKLLDMYAKYGSTNADCVQDEDWSLEDGRQACVLLNNHEPVITLDCECCWRTRLSDYLRQEVQA